MHTSITIIDDSLRYKLKSMQYIGPILMGIGMFLLIIACVITLESRDKHAQVKNIINYIILKFYRCTKKFQGILILFFEQTRIFAFF